MDIVIEHDRRPIKMWTDGVEVEESAMGQLRNVAGLDIVWPHVAVMPDVHWGIGATVGSVIPTRRAIIPAAVGVDIGCGMIAARTTLDANAVGAQRMREVIEDRIPVGGPGVRGSWSEERFRNVRHDPEEHAWADLDERWDAIVRKHSMLEGAAAGQLGTLGSGNHFIELCVEEGDPASRLWVMLHSGSRGPGNRIGRYFIEKAKEERLRLHPALGDPDLAWLSEGVPVFDDYVEAVEWAQDFARVSRELMLARVIGGLHYVAQVGEGGPLAFATTVMANCHHNYVRRERHFGEDVWVTRKGAVSARAGEFGIIPGSMGARSFIVRGLGNPESFETCSHGAGRRMSRGQAKREIPLARHIEATAGVECRKDAGVLDESPDAYKDIDAVMAAQRDLVEPVHVLKQFVCVKG